MIRLDATAARITRVARARMTNDGAHLVVTTGMLHRTRPGMDPTRESRGAVARVYW